ncbi:unnamed protein product, partial [Mesorhabditis belari]|uniref:Nephrocystin-4 n=1 Tax=Mesorhabditis belari TaxID=2138241 RepID=A0AAF3EJI2_9BILA
MSNQGKIHSVNEWYQEFLENRLIPPRRAHDFELGTPEGFAVILDEIQLNGAQPGCPYYLQVYFFDTRIRQFFGRPYRTRAVPAFEGVIRFNEELFFHCSILGEEVFLVFELIEVSPKDPSDQMTVGWTIQIINSHQQALQEYSTNRRNLQKNRLRLYPGTPKALVYTSNIEKETQAMTGAIQCTLLVHSKLLSCSDFIEEFAIIGGMDDVPGLDEFENAPQLASPHLLPPIPTFLDDVTISFGQHGDSIEKGLLDSINVDRLYRENFLPGKEPIPQMHVLERRLRVGVHNGFSFLGNPLVVHLSNWEPQEPGNPHSMRRRSKSPSRRTSRVDPSSILYVPTKISIPKVVADSRLAIVFALDYLMGIRGNDGSIQFTQSVLLCWGAWKPFGNEKFESGHQSVMVPLVGGPRPNPEETLCFKSLIRIFRNDHSNLPAASPQVVLNFNFYTGDEKPTIPREPRRGEKPSVSRPKSEPITEEIIPSKSRKDSPKKHQNELFEDEGFEEHLPTIKSPTSPNFHQISFDKQIDKVIDRSFIQSPRNDQEKDFVVMPGVAKGATVPRSIHSLLLRKEFPQILDRNGEIPESVEPTGGKLNEVIEKNDPLDTNEIVVQLMAFKWLNRFAHLSGGRKVFFTFQFYRFPQVTTERLLIDGESASEPGLLKRLNQQDQLLIDDGFGFMVRLTVDRSSLSPSDPLEFVKFLDENPLQIDVWDADSLQLIGTIDLSLKCLLRNGLESVQSLVQCQIIQRALPEAPKTTGLLFVRLACIGHPSSNQIDLVESKNPAIVSKRLQKLSEPGESFKIRVRPLNPAHENALQRFLYAQRLDISQRYAEAFDSNNLENLEQQEKLKGNYDFTNSKNEKMVRKFVFDTELEAYKKLRNESKAGRLLHTLFKGITTEHRIYSSIGESIFFEFLLHNTFPEPINCSVDIEEPGLQIISNADDWAFYKKVHNLETPLEKDFIRTGQNGQTTIFLKPKEALYVPFLYEDLKSSNHTDGQITQTKAIFKRFPSLEPLSILHLTIEHRPYILHKSMRFFGEEHSNLSKIIRLRGFEGKPRPILMKCSDPTVKVALRNSGVEQDLCLTAFCGQSCTSKQFLVLFYADSHAYRQIGVWQISIHSFSHFEIKGILSQTTHFTLEMKKSTTERQLIHFYPSSPQIFPSVSQPMLMNAEETKISMEFRPESTGNELQMLTAVDTSTRELLGGWMVHAKTTQPQITKQFEIKIPLSCRKELHKKLPIHNPYGVPRIFRITSSRPELVKIGDEMLQMASGVSTTASLTFLPIVQKAISIEVDA